MGASFGRVLKKKKRGGICILGDRSVELRELGFVKELASERTFECCGVEVVNYGLILICLYRTPDADIEIFFEKLQFLLEKLKIKVRKKDLILTGDWNINTLIKGRKSDRLKDILKCNNLDLHIHTAIRKKSYIEHFASTCKDAIGETITLELSDHDTAQFLSVPVDSGKKSMNYWFEMKTDLSHDNIIKFKYYLRTYPWFSILQSENPNQIFTTFHNELQLLYKLCFPKYKIKIKCSSPKLTWLTKGIRISCAKKRKLRICYYKRKSPVKKVSYRNYNYILKKCINLAQKFTNNKYINKAKNKCLATWNIINGKNSKCTKNIIKRLNVNNILVDDPVDIAREFNDHFINLTNKVYTLSRKADLRLLKQNSSTFFLSPTDEHEVKKIIKSLNNTNSTGYDEIPTNIIKVCSDELAPILAQLINLSFEHAIFPSTFKRSIVKPMFKKDDKQDLQNYRPITLIPVLSKVWENVLHSRLMSFTTKFQVIRPEQHGFQKGKSTTLACFSFIREILICMDKRVPVTSVLFDMSRAFDCVCHETLLAKLELYGIRGKANDLIADYLHGRTQCVEINNFNKDLEYVAYKSSYKINSVGVPQGSILGPLLFLLYINDLPMITQYPCTLFADDLSIVIYKKPRLNLEFEINDTIKRVVHWLECNNLKVNLNKTTFLQFMNRNKNPEKLSIAHNNISLVESTTTKFLGIVLDTHLTWKKHVESVCEKINRFVYALYRVKNICDLRTALIAYHGYVCSTLRYGIVIWGNSVDMDRAFVLQKKCVRAMYGAGPLDSCKPIFKELRILSLPSLYIFEMCNFVKKHKHLFTPLTVPFLTRYPNRLAQHFHTTKCFENNCYNMCIKLYNTIPDEIKMLPTHRFKKRLFELLVTHCFYTVQEFLTFKF